MAISPSIASAPETLAPAHRALPPCDVCRQPVTLDAGVLVTDVHAALRAATTGRLVPWRWGHSCCLPDNGPIYDIVGVRLSTSAQMREWTRHLEEKSWFAATDWTGAMRRLGLLEDER